MNLMQLSFLIFVFSKQFYIFSSGGLQPGDLFFLISFIIYIFKTKETKIFKINKLDIYLFIFIYLGLIINMTYFAIYHKTEFLGGSFHYIYNFMVVIVFRELIKDNKFRYNFLKILKLNLYIQFIIYIMGMGRYYVEIRYMGTFNDPNQMAFYIYMTMMIIVVISDILKTRVKIIYHLISWFLIIESSSTGMLLGISIFTVTFILFKKQKIMKKFNIEIKKILVLLIYIFMSITILLPNIDKVEQFLNNSLILERVEEKIDGFIRSDENKSHVSLVEDRSIDKLLIYPEKVLLGAGQGYYTRFNGAHNTGEIHSTLPSILFSYGIIPTILILVWFYKNIKSIPIYISSIYISLFIESFTLVNQRQPYFWMLFVLGHIYEKNKVIKN